MSRQEMIKKLWEMLTKAKDWEDVRSALNECMDWNMEHDESFEIYMNEDDEFDRVYIEDDFIDFEF